LAHLDRILGDGPLRRRSDDVDPGLSTSPQAHGLGPDL